jgi:hypothetical protein
MLDVDAPVSPCLGPWAPEGAAGGITVITAGTVNVTLLRSGTRAVGELNVHTFPDIPHKGTGKCNLRSQRGRKGLAFEATRLFLGTRRGRVVRAVAGKSTIHYL